MPRKTQLKLASGSVNTIVADVLAIPVFQGELGAGGGREQVVAVVEALGAPLMDAAKQERFQGKVGQRLTMHTHDKIKAKRVVLLGLGEDGAPAVSALRNGVGEITRATRASGGKSLAVLLPKMESTEGAEIVGAAAEAAILGNYRFDKYVSNAPDRPKSQPLENVTLVVERATAALKRELAIAEAVAEATNIARDLVNEPPGKMTPVDLAKVARALGRAHGLKVTAKGRVEIERLKMGLFEGVARGADTEPQIIVIEYKPAGRAKGKGVAFVGKGITFDSGGYDLKPPAAMDGMKMDMGGAAATIAVMRAVAEIKPPFPVTAYIGACENLVSGRAFKPGDVLESRKGITVEINNTDAEGRLVLGDLLTLANEKGHEAIIDVATLTGACVVALGPYTIGAFANDEGLAGELLGASEAAGEHVWRMPLNKALEEQLRSDIADTKNTGERMGGAITAALFLSSFVGDTPWAHLDIAGPAMYGADKGVVSKGASGAGVRTLARFVRARQERSGS